MSRPNVRESRASDATSAAPQRDRLRWLPPLVALLLLLIVLLSLRPPDGGAGDGSPDTAGNGHAQVGDGQGIDASDHGGHSAGEMQDLGGRDDDNDGDPSNAGVDHAPESATSPEGDAGNSTASNPAEVVGPRADAITGAEPSEVAVEQPTASLPELGFATDLTAVSPAAEPVEQPTATTQTSAAAAGRASTGRAGTPGLSSFFGAQGHGTRFVYIIDKSGSMAGAPFETAKRELVRSLRALQPHEQFFVAFYDGQADPMPGGRLVPATPANLERAVAWVRSVSLGGSTDPTEALTFALDKLSPDTIWLLSDGAFSAEVVNTITTHNRGRRTHINTLAFINRDGEALLKIIADQNQGDYRFVPGP